jgi:hypothetical protein
MATVMALLTFTAACAKAELQGSEGEVEEVSSSTVNLPQVPEFDEPKPYPDQSHPVREMRLKGNQFLDSSVQVKGYVVWVYDCAAALRTPSMTDEALKKLLKNEPERCDRPNFIIADEGNASPDKGIWVVEAPRPLRDDEKRLPPDKRKAMEKAWKEMPKFAVGDLVTAKGKWARSSPGGFRNSDGLLVYESMTAGSNSGAAPTAPSGEGNSEKGHGEKAEKKGAEKTTAAQGN